MTRAEKTTATRAIISRAFGADNRARLLDEWFQAAGSPLPENAWIHVYRLLLWIDRTTGLAHCYESDKSQPGRHWYGRSLAFHGWLSNQLGVSPVELSNEIDWLFKRAIQDLAGYVEQRRERLLQTAATQRARFDDPFPEPGDDPELFDIIEAVLEPYLAEPLPERVLRSLTRQITAHLSQENKRKNLIGEGFEDVLAGVVARMDGLGRYNVHTRVALHELPGFYPPRRSDKVKRVDLSLVDSTDQSRHLVTAKWSIRADREEQLATDFAEYERLEAAGEHFKYVLVTNEFDPARLYAACTRRSGNKELFSSVVHVNPSGLLAAYDDEAAGSAAEVKALIRSGRLSSLATWLAALRKED